MTSRVQAQPRRKAASTRRAEIVSAASAMAIADGLGGLTLRRVALAVGVVPGLINHYFQCVDDLVAAAFRHAAATELRAIFTATDGHTDPMLRLQSVINLLVSEDRDVISLLWLDAWQASRQRPALREEVIEQMRAWQDSLVALIDAGTKIGVFHVQDSTAAAVRILATVDGLSVQAAVRTSVDYTTVRDMVAATAERELGLPQGHLKHLGREA